MLIRVYLLVVFAALTGGAALAQEKSKPLDPAPTTQPAESVAEPLCPVMGEPIDRRSYTYYRGKRVYFCCEKCKGTFESDPDQYADAVRKQWDALPTLRVQVRCPGGEPLESRRIFVEEDEGRVYFCSERCKEQWQRGEERLVERLKREGYTFQVRCPCGGNEINPAVSRPYDGKTVYFCCAGCIASFEKVKASGLRTLDEQIQHNREQFEKQHGGTLKPGADSRPPERP